MTDADKSDETEITTGDGNVRRLSVFQADDPDRSVLHVISKLTGGEPPKVHLPEEAKQGAPTPVITGGSTLKGRMLDIPVSSGQYQILGEIATGGMGVVSRGHDMDLGRDVAVKMLRPDRVESPDMIQRFVEEAQIGGQLQHPGIVPVYELGVAENDRPYFTMKLIKGRTLAAILSERKDPSEQLRKYLSIFEQVCQAMAYAHSRAVIHRDLKPGNIMVGAFGEVLVVDWGFAKVLREGGVEDEARAKQAQQSHISIIETVRSRPGSGSSESVAGSVMGTPAYMPPEQAMGDVDRVDERADVFALGAILCEIITGAPPYVGESAQTIISASQGMVRKAHERLESTNVDPELVAVTKSCLMPNREARPRHAGVLAEQIGAHLTSAEERAQAAQIEMAEARVKAEELRKERRLAIALAASILLTIVLGGAGWTWFQKKREERVARQSAAIEEELDHVRDLFSAARSAPADQVQEWETALAAAEGLELRAGVDDMVLATGEKVHGVVESIRAGHEAAVAYAEKTARDAEMVRRLEELKMPSDEALLQFTLLQDVVRPEDEYANAFRWYGIDVTALEVDEAARRIRESDIAPFLAAALDHWASLRRATSRDPIEWQRLIRIAFEADPDEAGLHGSMREFLLTGDLDRKPVSKRRALRDLQDLATRSESEDIDASTYLLLAATLEEAGEEQRALDLYRLAQSRRPENFDATFTLGAVMERMGDLQEAARFYTVAVSLRPQHIEVRHRLGLALEQLERWKEAEVVARAILELHPRAFHMYEHLATCLREQGSLLAALQADQDRERMLTASIDDARSQLREFDQSARIHVALAELLAEREDEEGEIDAYRRAIEIDPADVTVMNTLGNRLFVVGRYEEALAVFDDALEASPDWAQLHKSRAAILNGLGQNEAAIEASRAAIRLDPLDPEAHLFLGTVLLQEELFDEAAESFRLAMEMDPEANAILGLVNVMQQAGRVEDIEPIYREALNAVPKSFDLHWSLGHFLRSQGRVLAARKELELALTLLPQGTDTSEYDPIMATVDAEVAALGDLGELDANLSPYEQKIAGFRAMTVSRPDDPQAWNSLGRELLEDPKYFDEARDAFEKVMELEPFWSEPHWGMARIAISRRETDQAIESLRRAIELRMDTPEVWFALGQMSERAGDTNAALEAYAEVLDRDEEHVEANARLEALLGDD